MPELAELKLTADYINSNCGNIKHVNVKKNPVHKGDELDISFTEFTIAAESRGKELLLWLKDSNSDQFITLQMTMGMSGHFQVTNTGQEHKHAHLKFYRKDGTTLSFVDVRRFGNWKQGITWKANRGPDPTNEPREFFLNIMTNLTNRAFKKPLYEVLMDQKYFNGIGNYLRAEIIYRAEDVDPFLPAAQQIAKYPKILQLCEDVPNLAYARGGGSIKDWKNPFTDDYSESFFLCYGNKEDMDSRKDKNGRTFWYDPKWNVPTHRDDLKDWDYYSGLPAVSAYIK